MEYVIALIVSMLGSCFGDVDFFVLYTLVSTALGMYRVWLDNHQ